jgi:hypothetical protein
VFFGVVALVSLLVLHGNGRKLFCGFVATIFSICMYRSPLSIMVNPSTAFYLILRKMTCILSKDELENFWNNNTITPLKDFL